MLGDKKNHDAEELAVEMKERHGECEDPANHPEADLDQVGRATVALVTQPTASLIKFMDGLANVPRLFLSMEEGAKRMLEKLEELEDTSQRRLDGLANVPLWLHSMENGAKGMLEKLEKLERIEWGISESFPGQIRIMPYVSEVYFPPIQQSDLRPLDFLLEEELVCSPAEAHREELWEDPVLQLKPVPCPKPEAGRVARLEGAGPFHDVSLDIPPRMFFWLFLLFNSKCSVLWNGRQAIAVSEHEAVALLEECAAAGRLRLSGKDARRPTARIRRMWTDFGKFLDKHLPGVHARTKKERGETHYVLDLKPDEIRCHVITVHRALTPRPRSIRRPRPRGER